MISASLAECMDNMFGRWAFAGSGLLLSAIVFAGNSAQLVISDSDGQLLSDEMYERAEGWRRPSVFEPDWRAPEPEQRSRIRFGFDSAFEEVRARDPFNNKFTQTNLGEPQPNTLFQLEFQGRRGVDPSPLEKPPDASL